ncbi:MAG: pyruvate dehydrogenase (acetyl-transferring) E1 component subunit alpha [Phycisphaeraceae bacterium]|nr:pyruvate dehydrogenase (acetyl-transferring) E1 component subunit alpha [Phycisphaeraceae bacterium]
MTILTGEIVGKKSTARPSDALDAGRRREMLRMMMLIRRFEERTSQSYTQTKIGGFCHIYIGQEATAVGSIAALRPDDPIITAYRDHGHALARGMAPRYCMAEMYGRITGCVKGKGGSMHMFDKPHHMYGGHAIVGGQAPLGVGLAFALQYEKKDGVVVCYFGDGALNQGALHESMNLAAIWRLPIIFVCENNMYSMGTHIARGTSMADDLSVKAHAYGITYAECDGMDVLDTYDTFKRLADDIRGSTSRALGFENNSGGGPAFVNCKTYRYKGHSMSDPQKYRTKDEVAAHEQQDPINKLANLMIETHQITQEEADKIDVEVKQISLDAVKFANESPETPEGELYTDVYANPFPPYMTGDLPEMLRQRENG